MNVAICEDIEKDASLLRLHVERYFKENNCDLDLHVYSTGNKLLEDIAADKLSDVIITFLDIYMPGANGIDTAKKIRATDNDMIIIFTTISEDHSLEGYSVYAMQYLVKPVSYAEVEEVLDKCMERFVSSLRYIEVLSDRLTVKTYLKDIMYIEFSSKASYIHTATEKIKTFLPLHELEKQLEGSTFLRTQRSYIVNMSYIKRMEANSFIMVNDTAIPIRRDDKMIIKQAYRDYLSAITWE